MSGHEKSLADVPTRVSVADGRLTMTADVEATCIVASPRHKPLSAGETHATVTVTGEDTRVELELDAGALQALADEVYRVTDLPRPSSLLGERGPPLPTLTNQTCGSRRQRQFRACPTGSAPCEQFY